MAKAQFVLVAIFLFAANLSQAGQYPEQTTGVEILRKASANAPNPLNTTYIQMANALNNAIIRIAPSGQEFNGCTPGILAYTRPSVSNEIVPKHTFKNPPSDLSDIDS